MQILSRYILEDKNPPKEGSVLFCYNYGWLGKISRKNMRAAILLLDGGQPFMYECGETVYKQPYKEFVREFAASHDIVALWQPFITLPEVKLVEMRKTAEACVGWKKSLKATPLGYIAAIFSSAKILSQYDKFITPTQLFNALNLSGY